MPDISLLEPMVLRGVVEKLSVRESLILLSTIDQTSWPWPNVSWDVIRGSRAVARPNVPNSEAHVVGRLGRAQESAAFIYLREKKVFSPTTLYWLRTPGQLAKIEAEKAVLREINDLNTRFDNFAELILWRALSGHISLAYSDVVAEVDYHFPASHVTTAAVTWPTASPVQIVHDIRCWKKLISRDGQVPARTAYGTEATISMIFDSFAQAGAAAPATMVGGTLLSDRMKDEYYRSGTLPGFMGLNWNMVESYYEDDSTAYSPGSPAGTGINFVPDGVLFIGNYTDNRPIELYVGPTADLDAPEGFTGKFSKTWNDKDPSARQYLLEWNLFPVITRPEQMMVACVGTPPACSLPTSCTPAFSAMPGSRA